MGGRTVPEVPQWARVRSDVNCSVRRGAWYMVVRLTPDAAILEVGQRSLSVPRTLVQVVPIRPRRWSVVARPYDAVDLPINWGSPYAVCPACRARMPLRREQRELRCGRCSDVFPIAWEEQTS